MATDKQVKYVQSLQKQYCIEKYTKEQISNMSHQEVNDVVNEFEKYRVKKVDKATSSQVELIMEMQDEAEVKWYNRRQIKNFSHQEIESLVIKLKNEVEINEMNRKAWKDQVNMWKEFEWLYRGVVMMIGAILLLLTVVILALILIVPLIHLLVMQFSSHAYLVALFTLVIIILVIVTLVRWTLIQLGI